MLWRWMGSVGRRPDFRRLWLASTGSTLGTCITLIALPLVAIQTLDASPLGIAALQIAGIVPSFVAGLFAGAWVDRLRKRPVMIACDLLRAATMIAIPTIAWLGWLTMPRLIAGAVVLALASLFFDVADRSLLPALVDRDEIADANRMITAGMTVSEAGGFAAGGWLVHLLSGPAALLVDAGSFLWSAALLHRLETPESAPAGLETREPIGEEIRAGIRLVRANDVLRPLAIATLIASMSRQIIGVVFMIYVSRDLGFGAGALGLIFATGGFFSLAGSVTGGRLTRRVGSGPTLVIGLLITAAGQGMTALATTPTILGGAFLVAEQSADFGSTIYEIGEVSMRQTATDDDWQGRMHGTFRVLEFGGYLLGTLAGAVLGEWIGARGTILAGAAGFAAAALVVGRRSPVLSASGDRRLKTEDVA